jgi:hypothetical protein
MRGRSCRVNAKSEWREAGFKINPLFKSTDILVALRGVIRACIQKKRFQFQWDALNSGATSRHGQHRRSVKYNDMEYLLHDLP